MAAPWELEEEARELLAGGPYGKTWLSDQHDAAAKELEPFLHSLSGQMGKPLSEQRTSVKVVAWRMSVLEAWERRSNPDYRCPHSFLKAPPPLIVDLGHGITACRDCIYEMANLPKGPAEDGKCDLCDEPNEIFQEFWLELGPAVIHGDHCDRCAEWSRG